MDAKEAAKTVLVRHTSNLASLSHAIHANPEPAFQEHKASEWVAGALTSLGYDVTPRVADLPTAFRARYGHGPLNIAIIAEYDALPDIGHACGHNIIAASAVGAAAALARVADDLGITVTVVGTPAEEDGGGKILMLERGAFDGIHAAMMIHPHATERVTMETLAASTFAVNFTGKPAHASANPEEGISASAAMALGQVGVGMLREHILSSDRIHGIVKNGGSAPNIVPEFTSGHWFVRAVTTERLAVLEERVLDVFRGAATMTGCSVVFDKYAPDYANLVLDERLAALWRRNTSALGRDSLPVQPTDSAASTDMGNISQVIPSLHPLLQVDAGGANIHEAAFAAAAASQSGDLAMMDGALAMAWTAIDVATDPAISAQLTANTYVHPVGPTGPHSAASASDSASAG